MTPQEKALGKKKVKKDQFYDPKMWDAMDRKMGNGKYLTNKTGVSVTPKRKV